MYSCLKIITKAGNIQLNKKEMYRTYYKNQTNTITYQIPENVIKTREIKNMKILDRI